MSEQGGDAPQSAAPSSEPVNYPPPAPTMYPGYGHIPQPPPPPPNVPAPPGYHPAHSYYQQGQPSYGYAAIPHDGLGTAALVLGIVGIVLGFFAIGIFPAILAIIFGLIVRRRAKRGTARNGGQALSGLITGIVGVVISLGIIATITVAAIDQKNCEDNAQTQAEFDRCSN